MIISFKHKGLERFFYEDDHRGIQSQHAAKLRLRLTLLGQAQSPRDVGVPGWRLHNLNGELNGFWSIQVDANWRLVFRFVGSNVELVNYVDYH